MSNAMRTGKRTLAGVAAGALGAALIPFIGVGSAQAAEITGANAWATSGPTVPVSYLAGAPAVTQSILGSGADSLGAALTASLANGGVGPASAATTYPSGNTQILASAPVLAKVEVTAGSGTVFPSSGFQITGTTGKTPGQTGYVSFTGVAGSGAATASTPVSSGNPTTFALTSNDGVAGGGFNVSTEATNMPGTLSAVSISANAPATAKITVWADSNLDGVPSGGENFATNSITFVSAADVSIGLSVAPNPASTGAAVAVTATPTAASLPLWNPSGTPVLLEKLDSTTSTWGTATTTGTGMTTAGTFNAASATSYAATATAGPTTTATALSAGSYRAKLDFASGTDPVSSAVAFSLSAATATSLSLTASGATFGATDVPTSVVQLDAAGTAIAAAPNNGQASSLSVLTSTDTVNVAIGGTAGTPVQVVVTGTVWPGTGSTLVVNGSTTLSSTSASTTVNTTAGQTLTLKAVKGTGVSDSINTLAYNVELTNPSALAGSTGAVSIVNKPKLNFTYATPVVSGAGTLNGIDLTVANATPGTVAVAPNSTLTMQGTVTDQFGNAITAGQVGIVQATPTTANQANALVSGTSASTASTALTASGFTGSLNASGADQSFGLFYDKDANGVYNTASGDVLIGYGYADVVAISTVTASAITANAATPANRTQSVVVAGANIVGTDIELPFKILNSATSPANIAANTPVTFSTSGGPKLFASDPTAVKVATGVESLTVGALNADPAATVWVASEKSGTFTVTVTAGGKTTTSSVTFTALTTPVSVKVAPTSGGSVPASVVADSVTSMTATVLEGNGNGVSLTGAQITITGDATFAANGAKTLNGLTSTAGTLAFDVRAGASGSFTVTAASTTVASATVTTPSIAITSAPVPPKSIAIAAYRSGGTVVVDGDAVGFARGDTVNIRVKLYNANTKKYTSWRGAGTALVKSGGSFSGFITTDRQVKVKVNGGGVVSNIVTVK